MGVAAPSSPFDQDLFSKGISILENMGFRVAVPDEIYNKDGFLAGDDEGRVAVLHRLFRDPGIHGIVCARGGYGSMRILDLLHGDLIRANSKPFMGFSDVTALLSAFHSRFGLVCHHGPVVTSLSSLDAPSLAAMEHLLVTGRPKPMESPDGTVIVPGRADGVVNGGNLATLCHLTGTAHAPDFTDSILMLEDVGEAPYKIDRMLVQMDMAGLFKGIRAVVCGTFERCGERTDIERVFSRMFGHRGIPVVFGFPFGHGSSNLAFPVGFRAVLSTDSMTVVFDES